MMKKVFDQTNFMRIGWSFPLNEAGKTENAKKKKNVNRGVHKLAENIGSPDVNWH
jgi:hypothetical protein